MTWVQHIFQNNLLLSIFSSQTIHSCHLLPDDEPKVWMPLHELIEPKETGRPLIRTVKWSLLMPAMRQFPFSQINYCKLGHQIKDRQLQRPRSDKMPHEGCYASSGQSDTFFSFPGTHWSEKRWKPLCSNQVVNVAYLTSHIKTFSSFDRVGKREMWATETKEKHSFMTVNWYSTRKEKEPFISTSHFKSLKLLTLSFYLQIVGQGQPHSFIPIYTNSL